MSATSGDKSDMSDTPTWAAVETDSRGLVTSWSAEAEQITGFSAAEMIGHPAWEICTRMLPPGRNPEIVRQRVKAMVERALHDGQLANADDHPRFRLQRPDGGMRTIEHRLSLVRSEGDRIMFALVREVEDNEPPHSDRHEAHPSEEDGDLYHRLFMENLSGTSVHEVICDESGKPIDYRFLDVNPAFESITGLCRAEIIGRTVTEVIPDIEPVWIERFGRVALTGVSEQFDQFNAALDRHFVVRAYSPTPGQFAAVFQDVTALNDRTSFAETIVSSVGEGIVVFDCEMRYLVFNPVMEEITGVGADEVIGRTLAEVFSTGLHGAVAPDFERALAGETVAHHDVPFDAPFTGQHYWIDATYHPHRNSRGEIVGVVVAVMDMTARHGVTADLARSEAEFRTIFDNVGDSVAISTLDGRLIEVNRVICERLGYTREELLKMSVKDTVSPEARVGVGDRTARIMSEGSLIFDSVHMRRDGAPIPVEALARLIEFRGQPAILTVHRDITERKQAEAAIRDQAQFLQQLIDAIPIPITAKTPDGRIALCNDAFTKGPGLSKSQAVGKTITELGRTGADTHEQMDRELMRTGGVKQLEDWMGFEDGTKRRLVLTKAAIKAQDGSSTGIVTATLDITERYVAEQALKQSEERFRSLFEHAGDAMFITGLDGQLLEVNETACTRLGYSREELHAISARHIETPGHPSPNGENLAAILEKGHLNFETLLFRSDGTEMPVDISAVRIDLGGTVAVLTIARDMTERKKAEAERAALEEQLLQAQKMEGIGRLAGGIAHDFNNLLTAIRGNASLALMELPPGSGPHEDLEQIVASADRAAALTRQLLAFARRTVLQPEVVDLGATVKRLAPMLTRLLGEDISLVTHIGAGGHVLADPSQIEQVIVNLAVNARDAMPDGGTLTISVSTASAASADGSPEGLRPGPVACLTVTDSGMGMDEATLGRIFEPFFTTKGPGKGTGLGLATVYGIVRQSGGTVAANSEPGAGSSFVVYLPLVAEAVPVVAVEPDAAPARRRVGTIMVVEDDDGVRRFANRVLEGSGHRVLAASSGSQAISMAESQRIDLLLTDVVMPGMSGHEVATRLIALQPDIRVLYMSGHTDKGIVRDGVLEPEVRYLAKPFSSEALLDAVEAIMTEPEGIESVLADDANEGATA